MTRKHFESIAKIIEQYNISLENGWYYDLEEALSDYFAKENPRFNRVRFLQACGIETRTNKKQIIDCGGVHASCEDIIKCKFCASLLDSM